MRWCNLCFVFPLLRFVRSSRSDDGTVGPPLSTVVTITATVVNVNDAPTFLTPAGPSISVYENTNGTVVYNLTVADDDVTDTRTFGGKAYARRCLKHHPLSPSP